MSRFGGWNRVDRQRLRKAVLDNDLGPMIRADASRATELICKASIDPEATRRAGSLPYEEGLGITEAPRWLAAVPERGPFLQLLMHDIDSGLDCILTLVDHATARWQENTSLEDDSEIGELDPFVVAIDGDEVALLGDAKVLHWHRNDGNAPTVLACGLMALESFLYRRLDADENIDPHLGRLKESRSAAIWGLLADIARYSPSLLRDQLSPLISSASLLSLDKLYAAQSHLHLGMAGIADRVYAERLHKWNAMPHRKTPLIDPLMRDVLSGEGLVEEMAAARELWRRQDPERWKHLIAQADPVNHSRREMENGAVIFEYVVPEELRPEVDASNKEVADSQFWLTGPYKIREWIDAESTPSDQQIEEFWISVQSKLEQPTGGDLFDAGVRSREDLECGIAALLVLRAREWLRSHPEREQWCRQALLAPFEGQPPRTHDFDFAEESSSERWDSFCADAIPILWSECPADVELRSAIARLAVHLHHLTIRKTFLAVAKQPALAEGLRQLEHLSLHWARFRSWRSERRHRERHADLDFGPSPPVDALPDIEGPTRRALDDFVEGSLVASPSLGDWLADTPESMLGPAMDARHRALSKLDLSYLIPARVHLPVTLSSVDEQERARRIEFATELAELVVTGLPLEDRSRGGPHEEDNSVYTLLAEMTLATPPVAARKIWQPIFSLGEPAHRWIEHFLGDVWSLTLSQDSVPEQFPTLIKEMIAFAAATESWRGRQGGSDLALALIGLMQWTSTLFSEKHRPLIEDLLPEWAEWVQPRLDSRWFAVPFVRFLGGDAAEPVRLDALSWLAEAERSGWEEDGERDDVIAELLLKIVAREPAALRGGEQTSADARYLLARLAGRGQPVALELSNRLG